MIARVIARDGMAELRHRLSLPLLLLLLSVSSLILTEPGRRTASGVVITSVPRVRSIAARATFADIEHANAVIASPVPDDTDLLLVTPAGRLGRDALASTLTRLGYEVVSTSSLVPAIRVRVPERMDAHALAVRLADSGLAASVEPDALVRADRLPDDALLGTQRPYLDAIHAPEAWERRTGAALVTIAVIDTGIDNSHPDLAARIAYRTAEAYDGADNDANGCIDDFAGCSFVSPAAADPSCGYALPAPHGGGYDDEGHGTFVAGIAAAAGDNAVGGTGIAWDARVLAVKVLDCTATGRVSDAAAGILYAARSGAHIIVVAFGSPSDSRVLREAVSEAVDRYGALIIASAGNEGGARVQFPAAYPGVLAVGGSGLTQSDGIVDYRQIAPFSNVGPELGLLAPASRIVAPLPAPSCGQRGWVCIEDQPYARASGTSFAAPLVAGAAALLLSRDPELRAPMLIALLRDSGQSRPSGPPLLDLAAARRHPVYTLAISGLSRAADGPPPSGPDADPSRGR